VLVRLSQVGISGRIVFNYLRSHLNLLPLFFLLLTAPAFAAGEKSKGQEATLEQCVALLLALREDVERLKMRIPVQPLQGQPSAFDSFSDWLRKRRNQKGITQTELCAATGIDNSYISQLEKGGCNKQPTIKTVVTLAGYFGESPLVPLELLIRENYPIESENIGRVDESLPNIQTLNRNEYSSFGNWIKKNRNDIGETQAEVADAIGVDHSYISQLEADKKDPSLQTIRDLAVHFEVSPAVPLEVLARQHDTAGP
jgi:transcriptional regulator with XRE-family HTH domain